MPLIVLNTDDRPGRVDEPSYGSGARVEHRAEHLSQSADRRRGDLGEAADVGDSLVAGIPVGGRLGSDRRQIELRLIRQLVGALLGLSVQGGVL
jgi:hypothetical protein